jgi:kynurenine formamidase
MIRMGLFAANPMYSVTKSLLGVWAALCLGTSPALAVDTGGEWVDLSHDFSDETIYWPTSEPFQLTTVFVGKTAQGHFYSAYKFCAAEHGGTHLDAPVHFAEGRQAVDQIPLDRLIGQAVKVDVSTKALADRDYQIGVVDLIGWESKHGRIPRDSIVLLQTGYSRHWPDRAAYLGTALRGQEGVTRLHFPGLAPQAAEWLVKKRKIKAVGLDTASIDYGQSKRFESHVTLSGQGVPVFENLTNLERLPARGAEVVALPMKIRGGSGAPLRIVARISGAAPGR